MAIEWLIVFLFLQHDVNSSYDASCYDASCHFVETFCEKEFETDV